MCHSYRALRRPVADDMPDTATPPRTRHRLAGALAGALLALGVVAAVLWPSDTPAVSAAADAPPAAAPPLERTPVAALDDEVAPPAPRAQGACSHEL
jgi:hypothetical protein